MVQIRGVIPVRKKEWSKGGVISYLDGRVPGQSALELLEPAGDLVAQSCVALLVVDLPAEQTTTLSGGAGGVLAGHFVVVVVFGTCGFGGWAERGEDF